MVARALKRSVGNRCHGHCLLERTGDEGKGMNGVGWEGGKGGEKEEVDVWSVVL
jgi:hypothetical protein